uniref:G_PROTEIN_RECEP_F1_2 domain-containing protein n=1 Tax=Macrostomum lignano TaxID=282301 RepID=A0A1I8H6G8_9PLAT
VCNMFIVSLASADFIVGAFVMPVSAVYVLSGRWRFGRALCQVWLSLDYTASTASILNLLILSLDRYWSVTAPLRYLPKRTRSRARLMIAGVWATSGLWIVPIFCWHWMASHGECDPEYKESFPLKIVTGLLNFYIPLSVMYVLYGRIFQEIRKRSKLEKQSGRGRSGANEPLIRQPNQRDRQSDRRGRPPVNNDSGQVTFRFSRSAAAVTVTVAGDQSSPQRTPSPVGESMASLGNGPSSQPTMEVAAEDADGNDVTSTNRAEAGRGDLLVLLRRLRNSQTVRWPRFRLSSSLQKEVKAAKQLGVIMGAFTACFLPYFVLFVVVAFCPDCVSDSLMLVATWIGYANSTFNPVLYPLCNHAFRRKFRSMLCCGRRRDAELEATRALYQRGRATFGAAAAVVAVNRRALDGPQ